MVASPTTMPTQTVATERIVAVVVTYNRRELLPLTLAGIAGGALRPDLVVVVNNASTDGTAEYLEQLDYELELDLVHLSENLGGAGGFTVGIDRALARHAADLVWVMDDDTEPTENTLSEAYQAWASYSPVRAERPTVVASRVVWTNGEDHPMNTMRTMLGAGPERIERAEAVGARPIRSASFVSILMDGAAMRATDLPLADFFIWNDDFEYTTRLIHHGRGIATPQSVARHHTKTFGTTDAKPGPRFYNDVRNKLWVFCGRRTLSPVEKALYGAATARLWVSTLIRTDEKKTYTGYFLRGVKDALGGYRSNDEVLKGIYELETPSIASRVRAGYNDSAEFSLLMSVYSRDLPEQLDLALQSSVTEQTLPPNQVVLVLDGPIPALLRDVIDRFVEETDIPVDLIELPQNFGLAAALREGLAACRYDIVARADADDVSLPHRFEEQVPLLAQGKYDVLGSAMNEFIADPTQVECVRLAPTDPEKIRELMPSRNPMLHPTVVFRKSAVDAVGGYTEVPGAEDYWLWARMNRAGFVFGNLEVPLVGYRISSAYAKRGGLSAYARDFEIQRRLYNGGVLSKTQWARNMAVRSVYRFVPLELRKKAFQTLTSVKTAGGNFNRKGDHG